MWIFVPRVSGFMRQSLRKSDDCTESRYAMPSEFEPLDRLKSGWPAALQRATYAMSRAILKQDGSAHIPECPQLRHMVSKGRLVMCTESRGNMKVHLIGHFLAHSWSRTLQLDVKRSMLTYEHKHPIASQ